jgi:hypothetical protein
MAASLEKRASYYQQPTIEEPNQVMSTQKKVLFIVLGILTLGIILLYLGIQRSPELLKAFQCGYNFGLNNSSLTQYQIIEYCNNQILQTAYAQDLTRVGTGTILIIIALINLL